ncbi:MAG: fibronectin type III domain-containing protein, partial [Nitrospira sp. SB0677_bin_15]|nr:fibronectin type III domain-containing protein [Nitrospira sp. SB0677_bin_15]
MPFGWALKPTGLAAGTKFRLLFITSTSRDGTATDIATYNTFVQTAAKAGHSAISDSCGNKFKVVGSTSSVDARVNTDSESTDTDALIYWLNGAKAADNYADFYDGGWDSVTARNESGATMTGTLFAWTGSQPNGTKRQHPLGNSPSVTVGRILAGFSPFELGTQPRTNNHRFYALSPVFTVAAPPLTGSVSVSTSEVRLLETGSATYTVVLDAEPTANVTMRITRTGTHTGAATISPSSHTFTSGTNGTWDDPVTITVTGSDQSGTNANRELTLSHAFTSSDSRYDQTTRTLAVKVDDAPEVEAWEGWVWNHGALDPNRKMERPRTVTSTPGLSLGQDIVAGPLDYVIRLSNRPETGGTVTVTATVGDSNLAGISLTRDGAPQNSLTLTFSDRDPSPHCDNSHHDGGGEDHDNTPETSWQCWRKVWVHDLAAGKTGVRGCTDITHTATGGGVRGMTGPYSWSAGTIRAHMMSQSRQGPNGQEFRCPMITGKSSSPGMGSQNSALQVAGPPTDPVANLQLAALDASSAKATWDAVAGATGYRVEWEATDGLNVVAGVQDGVTETAFTIAHNTPAATTLTVRVLPEHVDGEGNPQALDALAGTATLALGSTPSDAIALQDATPQGPTEAALKACVPDGLLATAERLYERNRSKPPHYAENWFSVLMAFGQRTPSQWTADNRLLTPMSAASARKRGWRRFGDALACLETYSPSTEVPSAEGDGDPLPSVRIAAGAAVTEGAAAGFTLEVQPAPASDLAVTMEIAQTGAVLDAAALGERTVTVPAGKTEAAFTVATTAADETDEPAGAVTATVVKQDGYAVDKEHG